MDDPYGRVVALTAIAGQGGRMGRRRDPRAAVRRKRRRALFAVVVDRLSRWRWRSAGTDSPSMLDGAAAMDRHFRETDGARQPAAARRLCRPAITPACAAAETRAVLRL